MVKRKKAARYVRFSQCIVLMIKFNDLILVQTCSTSVRVVCWCIFRFRLTVMRLAMLGLFGIALSERRAEENADLCIKFIKK